MTNALLPAIQVNPTPAPDNLADQELATWLDACWRANRRVGYLHGSYLCKVADLSDPNLTLHPADPENETKKVLKKLVTRSLLQHLELPQTTLAHARTIDPSWILFPVDSPIAVNGLVDMRQELLGRIAGRGQDITPQTAQRVWSDAGARCMFEGCARDLSHVPFYKGSARVGYLAHIIASDPRGPRGSATESHQRSNDPDNVMLLCDEHHRLIDSFAPDQYPADMLYAMRQSHRDLVRSYLDSLAFPRAKALTLHANLAQVPTYFQESEFIEAILATGRAMQPGVLHYIRRTTQRDERNTPGFWANYLREHESHIRQLVSSFNDPGISGAEEFAVFPLHHIATMVLAGRIMGEARAIQVFQYHRQRATWAWDPNTSPLPANTFSVNALPTNRSDEVLITLELTARIDDEAMPAELAPKIAGGSLPWLRITLQSPRFDCISHPADLDQFSHVARKTINHVQDVMRARKAHLIAISPPSTVFRFGQMLQAGHHPEYIIYDRAGRNDKFVPAFSITGHDVSASCDDGRPITISIR
ncbi:hypothetical protein GCM10007933_15250 [Zoogloea oryzae]|uniref:SAVED domain-containing protein n=1 Tax=Zoogloea oryzae TaxID=310767 RepID=A0ABQ6FAQ9_9RHOO|nr:SAVED domain-containing protein [Zoogloea oryzae]GLT22069.1 hypothetical protein GCM10007933_15250 [Zoogloea oryzae]